MSKYFPCPCQSKLLYSQCCKRFHDGAVADTPEELMRSRYAAYALGLADYIMDTTHSSNDGSVPDRAQWRLQIEAFCRATQFVGLRVWDSAMDGDSGSVTFLASLKQNGEDVSFEERSEFKRENGRWLYASGTIRQP